MGINEQEALARQLYKLYWEAIGIMYHDWDLVQDNQREAWIQVAQFVEKISQGVMANTLIIYGYNGKEPYHGLDELIYPDHK